MAIKTPTLVDPFDSARERGAAGVFGMWVFIAVVAMVFPSTVLGYLVVRFDQPPGREWMPSGTPPLPSALLLSTVLLLASSWTMQSAVRAARAPHLALGIDQVAREGGHRDREPLESVARDHATSSMALAARVASTRRSRE